MIHVLGIAAIVAGLALLTFLPFLPGRYDILAGPLSVISQVLGTASLLVVPSAALWLASGYWNRRAGKHYVFAVAALIASTLVWLFTSLAAMAVGGSVLGIGAIVLWVHIVVRLWPRLRALRGATTRQAHPAALYLLIVPVATVLIQVAVAPRAVEYSRSRAIRNSEPLIVDIERYRLQRGRYPASLQALWPDYWPSVIGIERFHYEPSGDAYNLFFEQLTFQFGTREIVMYNPRGEQVMTSHTIDLLQFTGEQLERRRGFYAVHHTAHPHWKYFWFD